MKISIDLPDSFVQVVDTTNYKGVPITVLYVMGKEAAYWTGRNSSADNETWEDIIKLHIARFFGEMMSERFEGDWSTTNPTGREISDPGEINFVREEY
jgi:hypothetical protein